MNPRAKTKASARMTDNFRVIAIACLALLIYKYEHPHSTWYNILNKLVFAYNKIQLIIVKKIESYHVEIHIKWDRKSSNLGINHYKNISNNFNPKSGTLPKPAKSYL